MREFVFVLQYFSFISYYMIVPSEIEPKHCIIFFQSRGVARSSFYIINLRNELIPGKQPLVSIVMACF